MNALWLTCPGCGRTIRVWGIGPRRATHLSSVRQTCGCGTTIQLKLAPAFPFRLAPAIAIARGEQLA